MDFWYVIYETLRKKNIHFTTDLYIQVKDILKFYEVFFIFLPVCIEHFKH